MVKEIEKNLIFPEFNLPGTFLRQLFKNIKIGLNFKKSKCIFVLLIFPPLLQLKEEKFRKIIQGKLQQHYIASGIDPKQSSIFVQSSISGHSELSWILGCFTPIGWLNRMTQLDKAGKNRKKLHWGYILILY